MQEYELFLQLNSNKTNIDDIFSVSVIIEENLSFIDCNDVFNVLVNELNSKNFFDVNSSPIIEIDNSISFEMYSCSGKIMVNIKTQIMEYNEKNILLKQLENNPIKINDSHITKTDIKLWDNWMQYVIMNYSLSKAEEMIWLSLKNNLYNEKIIVNTISNEKNILPIGSTAIDLAFNISEAVGFSAITCKINGVVKSLFTKLNNGDIVEIISSPNCKPDSSWLNYVVSFKAVAYLTNYLGNKYQINQIPENIISTCYQKIIITSKKNNNALSDIRKIIGIDKIKKITFANNINDFIIAVLTNIDKTICTNRIFSDLTKLKGIKKIEKQMYY